MFKPERLMALCDGVIAIAITLLVLGLEVPSVAQVPDRKLSVYLYDSLHPLLGYVVSFILVGTYWMQHYVIFHFIKRVDRMFVILNGLFLLAVSFVPFPTGLQASYRHDELAMVLYAGTQALCGLLLWGIWTYAAKGHRLICEQMDPVMNSRIRRWILLTPAVSLVAIPVSYINIDLCHALFIAIPAACLLHPLEVHSQAGCES